MKLSLDCTFLLIFLMTCVELFVTARPTNIPQGKNGLQMLQQEMRTLFKIVSEEKQRNKLYDFEQSLTSLPPLNFSTEDLKSLEMSSTLAQLYSGLKSFKFHLDWIQQKEDEMGNDYSMTKKIAHHIQTISHKVLTQIGAPPSELVHPSLPPLKTAWSLFQAKVEIHEKLYHFCNWYFRALAVLRHRQQ
uniref:Interleukin-11 b n=1 Tax=Ctenopharyngodon idella TaxID=7959 RepID=A0A977WKX2_CTEID|nr:interleukin-11 b [Ctenopharyngodon idella]